MIDETFFDKNIITEKSNNIRFEINKPKFVKTVLRSDKDYEGSTNGYYKIILKDNKYQLFYRSCNLDQVIDNNFTDCTLFYKYENVCIAEGSNGLNFEYKRCLSKDKNNIFLNKDKFCHNFYPEYFEHLNIYLAISGSSENSGGLFLFESKDGYNWKKKYKILDGKDVIQDFCHKNHFDCHNNIVYNKFDKHFYIFIRNNIRKSRGRFVQYTKTVDLKNFTKMRNIEIINDDGNGIYNFNVFMYPNSYYFIAIPSFAEKNDILFKKCNKILYSINGEIWYYLDNNFINSDKSSFFVNGIVKSLDNKYLYFYQHYNYSNINNCINLYKIDYNKINKIICDGEGFIKIKSIYLRTNNLFINCKINKYGKIIIKLYPHHSLRNSYYHKYLLNQVCTTSIEYKKISFNQKVEWKINKNLIGFKEGHYTIKFKMKNCILNSFSYES